MKKTHKWGIAILIALAIILLSIIIIYNANYRETETLDQQIRSTTGHSYITLSNGVTHYQLLGPDSCPTLVLVHGATIPMWTWDKQVQPFADAGFRVLRYDHYGRGLSDRPLIEYNRELYTTQLIELLDALNIKEPVHMLGHCFGASIAAEFTVTYPDRVSKVAMLAPFNDFTKYKTIAGTGMKLCRMPVMGRFFVRTIVAPHSVKRNCNYLKHCGMNVSLYDSLYKQQVCYTGFEHSMYSLFITDASGDYIESYKKLGKQKREILTIWGAEDQTVTKPVVDDVIDKVKNTEYKVYNNAGHQVNWERTEDFNTLVTSFLTGKSKLDVKKDNGMLE